MQETSEKSVAMYGVVPASKIIGETVVNRQGENVGKIHELVIDARKNRVAYAVLSFGGFLGMGNKLFAMPWEAFEFSATEHKLILNVEKEKLKTAPGFEKDDKWLDFSDTLLIGPRGDRAFLSHRRSKIISQGKEGMYFGYMVAAGCSLWLLFIAFLWQHFL